MFLVQLCEQMRSNKMQIVVFTDQRCHDDHRQEVEVGDAPELLEQVLRQERNRRVLG